MTALEERLGHSFRNRALLETAVTHSSYANENRASGIVCNERLEFLGDSVLGVTVADFLYRHFPDMPEGRMTRLRAELVCEQSLHRVALELHLGDYLRLGKGEEHNGGRERASILSDAVEAVIAAMYLDAGMETAAGFIHRCLLDDVRTIETPSFTDYKTALQELVQRQSGQVLSYELVGEEGPDHAKTFRMQVCLNGEPVGLGTGRTKKEAEQTAAMCKGAAVICTSAVFFPYLSLMQAARMTAFSATRNASPAACFRLLRKRCVPPFPCSSRAADMSWRFTAAALPPYPKPSRKRSLPRRSRRGNPARFQRFAYRHGRTP